MIKREQRAKLILAHVEALAKNFKSKVIILNVVLTWDDIPGQACLCAIAIRFSSAG